MARWLKRLAVLLVVLAVVLALRYTVFRPAPVDVTVYVVARGRVEETVTNSKAGTVETRHRARLSPETGGRVAELAVREGDRVTTGQVLVRLDDSQQRAQLDLAMRSADTAREREREACLAAQLAQRDMERVEGLAPDELVSAQMLDQAVSRRDVAAAGCDAAASQARQAAAQVTVARTELDRTILRAPFDGIVAEKEIEKGEWITPSPPGVPIPPVIDLIDPDAIYVRAPLDEIDLRRVEVGRPVRITMDAFPGRSFPGRVTRIAPFILDVAEQSRTFDVETAFDDEAFARTVPPGGSADIEVILDVRDQVLRIPAYALIEGKRALVLEGDGLVGHDVEVGLRNWEFAEIRSGLSEGDRVVVSLDRAEVREGARAREAATVER